MREAAKALVRSDSATHNLVAGDPPARASHAVSLAEVEVPGAERPLSLVVEPAVHRRSRVGPVARRQRDAARRGSTNCTGRMPRRARAPTSWR